MWLLKFRFGFYCILLTVIVHRGSFLTRELKMMSTLHNWIYLKITISGMRNGVCSFLRKMWPFERTTFLAGESGSEFLEGHLFNSLSNVHWFMTVLWLSLPPKIPPWYLYASLHIDRDWGPILCFLLLGMANVSFSWQINIRFIFEPLGKGKKEGVRMYFYWSGSCYCMYLTPLGLSHCF